MGTLKPNTSYVYERVGTVVYAREFGSDPSTRVPIGWDYNPNQPKDGRETYVVSKEARLWKDIRETARTNKSLQKVLDRAILIYNIIKDKK